MVTGAYKLRDLYLFLPVYKVTCEEEHAFWETKKNTTFHCRVVVSLRGGIIFLLSLHTGVGVGERKGCTDCIWEEVDEDPCSSVRL